MTLSLKRFADGTEINWLKTHNRFELQYRNDCAITLSDFKRPSLQKQHYLKLPNNNLQDLTVGIFKNSNTPVKQNASEISLNYVSQKHTVTTFIRKPKKKGDKLNGLIKGNLLFDMTAIFLFKLWIKVPAKWINVNVVSTWLHSISSAKTIFKGWDQVEIRAE